jgi:uncharacterized protein YndB with AHSA1/START domain
MWVSEQSVDIQAPVEQVYRRLTDFSGHPEFAASLIRLEQITSGAVEVGTRFRALERVPREFSSMCEITALEEPRLIAWKAWLDGVMRTEWEFRLSPNAAGGTHLIEISRWQPTGPMGLVMLNLHRKRNAPRENRRTLDRIKAVLEAEHAAAKVAA